MTTNRVSPGLIAGISLATALLGGGCATRYDVQVDALARAPAESAQLVSYRIQSRDRLLDVDRLRHQEMTRHIRTALSARGLYEAPKGVEPDLIVELEFGIDAPRVTYEKISSPIYGPADPNPLGRDSTRSLEPHDTEVRRSARIQAPQRTVVGYEERMQRVLVFEKHLTLSARENKLGREGRPPNEIFNVRVTIENESRDLRAHLPILASAAMDKLGQTTAGRESTVIHANDASVAFINRSF